MLLLYSVELAFGQLFFTTQACLCLGSCLTLLFSSDSPLVIKLLLLYSLELACGAPTAREEPDGAPTKESYFKQGAHNKRRAQLQDSAPKDLAHHFEVDNKSESY